MNKIFTSHLALFFANLIYALTFGVAINMSFFFLGLNYTTPIHAAVTMTSAPIIIFILAVISHGEKKSPHRIVGVVLGAIGALILAVYGRKFETGNPHLAIGNLFVLINAFSYFLIVSFFRCLKFQGVMTIVCYPV